MFSRLEKKEAFTLVGLEDTIPFTDTKKVMPLVLSFLKRFPEIKHTINKLQYALSCDGTKESFVYHLGLEVSKTEDMPEGMVVREVPTHEYAVIIHKGSKMNILETYDYFFKKWLVEEGYEHVASHPTVEIYDERFIMDGPDVDKSIFEYYFPIKKKVETA